MIEIKKTGNKIVKDGYVLGSEISMDALTENTIFMSEKGRVDFFLGYQDDKQPRNTIYYGPNVAARFVDARQSYRFITLNGGVIRSSGFLNDDVAYKVIDNRYVIYPRPSNSYLALCVRAIERKT